MKIIGVTGGIGSGKSTVCRILNEFGAAVIDADKISHSIMNRGSFAYNECVGFFGENILDKFKEIDRKRLADIVFNDEKQLEALNRITHKYIFEEMNNQILKNRDKDIIVLDVPLLFDSDFPIKCDATVGVTADEEIRVARAANRDSVMAEKVRERIKNQISDEEYYRLADFVIENNGSEEELLKKVKELYEKIVNKLEKRRRSARSHGNAVAGDGGRFHTSTLLP